MVSFQYKLAAGLEKRGIGVCFDLADQPYQAILVIGGTRQLAGLWQARRRGVRIVQRLDGMNWLHRLPAADGWSSTRLRHYLRAEYGNWLLAFIRARLAQAIVYQSNFAQGWWERVHGPTRVPHSVIYNGVDLDTYTPKGKEIPPQDRWRILLVEGSLMGGYERGLETAVGLAEQVQRRLAASERPVELMVVGRVPEQLRESWQQRSKVMIDWAGLLARQQIPAVDRSAHLLYSADLNAACPNSVIEALACGLPVLAFDTGALPELVTPQAGRVIPYGGDPWQLDPADVPGLAAAALDILQDQAEFRRGARQRAEDCFGLDAMVKAYLNVLLPDEPSH